MKIFKILFRQGLFKRNEFEPSQNNNKNEPDFLNTLALFESAVKTSGLYHFSRSHNWSKKSLLSSTRLSGETGKDKKNPPLKKTRK